MSLERVILSNLIHNEPFARRVVPFLRTDYFQDQSDQAVFGLVDAFVHKYNALPTREALLIDLQQREGIGEQVYAAAEETVNSLQHDPNTDLEWLVDQAERFCQDRAVYNGIRRSLEIINDTSGKETTTAIPQILTDALAVSFDTHIGHDYVDDAPERFDRYHEGGGVRVPFDLDWFNRITLGGLKKKTLNVLMAGVNVGKSLFMCHMAAANLAMGKNVLYITLEMAEDEIAKRIDSNLLDIPIEDLETLPKDALLRKMERFKLKSHGKLIIKEYPTSCAGAANFRHLLNELKIKRCFAPDVIYIDYINICMSSRIKMGREVNSYTYVKAIAEELRGLAVEFDLPIVSATQVTRSGFSDSDVGLDDTSESFALPALADLQLAVITTDELMALNQFMVKQLKSRYRNKNKDTRFVIGVDWTKMRLHDVESSAQEDVLDGPVMDSTQFGRRDGPQNRMDRARTLEIT